MVELAKVYEATEYKRNNYTYDLFSTSEYAKFSKSNVERRTNVRPIFLSYHHNIDSSSKSGRVYLVVKSSNVRHKTT